MATWTSGDVLFRTGGESAKWYYNITINYSRNGDNCIFKPSITIWQTGNSISYDDYRWLVKCWSTTDSNYNKDFVRIKGYQAYPGSYSDNWSSSHYHLNIKDRRVTQTFPDYIIASNSGKVGFRFSFKTTNAASQPSTVYGPQDLPTNSNIEIDIPIPESPSSPIISYPIASNVYVDDDSMYMDSSITPPTDKGSNGISKYYLKYYNNDVLFDTKVLAPSTLKLSWRGELGTRYNNLYTGDNLKIMLSAVSIVNNEEFISNEATWVDATLMQHNADISKVTNVSFVPDEKSLRPIPTCNYIANWNIENGYITGVKLICGEYEEIIDNKITLSKVIENTDIGELEVGDTLAFKIYAVYTYKGNTVISSTYKTIELEIIADKFVNVSINGSKFEKHKLYISIDGEPFVEILKDKFNII